MNIKHQLPELMGQWKSNNNGKIYSYFSKHPEEKAQINELTCQIDIQDKEQVNSKVNRRQDVIKIRTKSMMEKTRKHNKRSIKPGTCSLKEFLER